MRTEDSRHWLRHVYVTRDGTRLKEKVISSRISNCENVERHEGDLDQHAAEDRLAGLLSRLAYSSDDQRRGQPPRHRVPIVGNLRTGSATLKAAVNLYKQFCEAWPPGAPRPEGDKRSIGPQPPKPPKVPIGAWPTWHQPNEAEVLVLAKIVMPYVRFLSPNIVAAIVADNQQQREQWSAAFKARGIDPGAYLWDRSPCAFPGIRRYAGSRELAIFRRQLKGEDAKFDQALVLDDNDYPKHLWSYMFRGKQFQKKGPVGYSLAHLADHKKHGNRSDTDFEAVDGVPQTELHGLYSCPTNTAFIHNSMIKPTDFGGSLRNLLLRRAQELYGNYCNLFPEWLRLRRAQSDEWELDKFGWADPVGNISGVTAFLDYRNKKIGSLLAQQK